MAKNKSLLNVSFHKQQYLILLKVFHIDTHSSYRMCLNHLDLFYYILRNPTLISFQSLACYDLSTLNPNINNLKSRKKGYNSMVEHPTADQMFYGLTSCAP